MRARHCRRLLRTTALAVTIALAATHCTGGGGDEGGGRDGDGPGGLGPTVACPDLVVVECQDQVATADIALLGTDLSLHYASDRVPGRTVAPRWDARREGFGGWTLVGHDVYDTDKDLLFTGDGDVRTVKATDGAEGLLLVPSADGLQVGEFDGEGRHLRTIDAETGVVLRAFGYDGDGRLVKVTDRQGAVSKVERDKEGALKGMVAPQGVRTELRLSPDGFLAGASDPIGRVGLEYKKKGLLIGFTDAGGRTTRFSYDRSGRLSERTDAGGVTTTFSTKTEGKRSVVTATLPSGRSTRWTFEELGDGRRRHAVRGPDGVQVTETISRRERSVVLPDGSRLVTRLAPDPRWDGRSQQVSKAAVTTPGGRAVTVTLSTKVELVDADDPLTVRASTTSLKSGESKTTQRWDARSRSLSIADTGGSRTAIRIDKKGNVLAVTAPGQAAVKRTYDRRGRLVGSVQGDRKTKFAYHDDTGEVEVTDPLGQTWRIGADAQGRMSSTVRPDGRRVTIERSPAGLPVAVRVDAQQVHTLGWSPAGTPIATGPGGVGAEPDTATLDKDGRTTEVRRGDGRTPTAKYTDAGLASIQLEEGDVTFKRDEASGEVVSSTPSGTELATTRDGFLVEAERLTGPASGEVAWKYDEQMRVSALDVAGVTMQFERDHQGRLVTAGDLEIERDTDTGQVTATKAGTVTSDRSYDAFGAVEKDSFSSGTSTVLATKIDRDAGGRIVRVAEEGGSTPGATAFEYDSAGRLARARSGGGDGWSYTYDDHDNRTQVTGPDGSTVDATYDDLDRLVRLGDLQYSWRADGTLESVTGPDGTTKLRFDELGQLTGATTTEGEEIGYLIDGRGRRVGRTVDGRPSQGFLYGEDLSVVAETGPDGAVVRRFVPTGTGAPSLMVTDDATYRIISDHTGSPRRVVDTGTGKVVQEIDYDPFGRILRDTKPGFQPFGFGGGLVDPDTGLVHHGARDYDPAAGRWISRDPSYLAGGQINPYTFANDDPVNQVDPSGLQAQPSGGSGPPDYYEGEAPTYTLGGDRFGLFGGPFTANPNKPGGLSAEKKAELSKEINEALAEAAGLGLEVTAGRLEAGGATAAGQSFKSAAGGLGKVSIFLGAKDIVEALQKDKLTSAEKVEASAKAFALGAEILLLGGPALVPFAGIFAAGALALGVYLIYLNWDEAQSGRSSGDVHVRTIDGTMYDFQAVGEFVATRADDGEFEVQVRLAPPPQDTARTVSVTTAVAAELGGDRVTVGTEPGSIRVNGRPVDLTGALELPKGGRVVPQPNGDVLLLHPDGESGVLVQSFGDFLDATVAVPKGRLGHLQGLYGDGDGDPDNDLVTRDGAAVDPEPGDHTAPLYTEFAASWRVSQDESLFDYDPGTDTATFTDTTFPNARSTVEDLGDEARADAERTCKAAGIEVEPMLGDCILDVGATGDPGYATSALTSQTTARRAGGKEKKPSSPSDADELEVGEKVTSKPTRAGERKRHRFTGLAGEAFYIKVSSTDETCAAGLAIAVVAPSGTEVFRGTGCVDVGRLVLEEDGPYQVVVTAQNSAGDYALTLLRSTPDQRFEIALGEKVGPGKPGRGAGTIDRPGAQDFYVLRAEPGQELVEKGLPGSSCEFGLRPFDSDGNAIQGLLFVCGELPFTVPADGVVELRVVPINDEVGDYTFVVEPA